MNILTLDVETTIYQYEGQRSSEDRRGSPFSTINYMVACGWKWLGQEPYSYYKPFDKNYLKKLQDTIDVADLLVGFNIKFDLHWLRRYGIEFQHKKIWDLQIGEFIIGSQGKKYPSLNYCLEKYGLSSKLDVIETEYWSKCIDTNEIPKDILIEYLDVDLICTEEFFMIQKEQFKGEHKNKYKLFQLQCEDLKVLQEMEYNGLRFNSAAAREEAKAIEKQLEDVYRRICEIVGIPSDIPFNLNSNDHLSAVLYGGTITWSIKVPDGVYKTGARVGQIRYKNQEMKQDFPQLVKPLDKSETKKSKKNREEGDNWGPSSWSVAEDVLLQLKAKAKAKELIDLILEYGKLEKLKGTYLEGFSDLIEKMNWPTDMLHGNLNQCSVVTGRLSSTKP